MAPPCSRWHGGVSHPLAPAGRRRHLESRSPCRPDAAAISKVEAPAGPGMIDLRSP